MAMVSLICGKICSGKSTYAKGLAAARHAVILSADEIMLALFGQDAGERHEYYAEKLQAYLFQKTVELTESISA